MSNSSVQYSISTGLREIPVPDGGLTDEYLSQPEVRDYIKEQKEIIDNHGGFQKYIDKCISQESKEDRITRVCGILDQLISQTSNIHSLHTIDLSSYAINDIHKDIQNYMETKGFVSAWKGDKFGYFSQQKMKIAKLIRFFK